ncbi:hypothetical protein, partial [Prosthecobacter sp.]|uniref:hypothetical protein n=1 Tax=Prosthecobacter sp. TaxID=1965333 RepID=UPI0037844E77
NLPLLARVTNFNRCSGVGVVFHGIDHPQSVTYVPGQSVTYVPGSYRDAGKAAFSFVFMSPDPIS